VKPISVDYPQYFNWLKEANTLTTPSQTITKAFKTLAEARALALIVLHINNIII